MTVDEGDRSEMKKAGVVTAFLVVASFVALIAASLDPHASSSSSKEVELLAKKYEERYKQVGELASKLAVEEAKHRDIQERKMELHNAIIKMEQGGSTDGLLQVGFCICLIFYTYLIYLYI
ncbi:hypothetical protein GW17_00046199 [Ensete ventricosum]|nr:hypothetical protein GW17_00046199 [Ensete ventricosum]